MSAPTLASTESSTKIRIRSALFQISHECNFRCTHCSQDAPYAARTATSIISYENAVRTIDVLHSRGLKRIRFTGGEPLLHPNIDALVERTASLGISTSLVTNGSRLRHHREAFAELAVTSVWLSVYGPDRDSYRAISGIAFAPQLLESVEYLTQHNVQVGLYCPIGLSAKQGHFPLVRQLYSHGARRVKFIQLMEQGRHEFAESKVSPEHSVSPLSDSICLISKFASAVPEMKIQVSIRSGQRDVFARSGYDVQPDLTCAAGREDNWAVDPLGQLYSCCLALPKRDDSQSTTLPSATKPIKWQRPHDSRDDKDNSCFALPLYPRGSDTTAFACPLQFAELRPVLD